MLVVQQIFTRPNTSVDFYSVYSAGDLSVLGAITELKANGDIVSFTDNLSEDGLVMTRIVNFANESAFDRIGTNQVLAANKQRRIAYNTTNGITEAVSIRTV